MAGTGFNLVELVTNTGPIKKFVSEMFPPDLSVATLGATGTGILETFQMSFLGALIGAIVALPLAATGTQAVPTIGASPRRARRAGGPLPPRALHPERL